jgi:uncharacterized protein (TIGR03435 family)
MWRRYIACAGLVIASLVGGQLMSAAQSAAANGKRPVFEVASVKINRTEIFGGGPYFIPGGRFRIIGGDLRRLVAVAYSYDWGGPLAPYEILGGPKWIDSGRFDIEATADVGNGADSQALLCLQRLLEDRFKLRVHRDTRERPVLNLVRTQAGGKLGTQLLPSTLDCSKQDAAGLPPAPPSPNDQSRCGLTGPAGHLVGRGVALSQLATRLSSYPTIARWVFDRTGLSGRYDFDLTWTPTVLSAAPAPDGADSRDTAPADGAAALATALQEQLGLKLQSGKGKVTVLVIDAAELPSEN